MSIRKMIALHPDVKGHVNQPLGDAVHHAMYCAKMCLSCADACAAEGMDMRQCIRMCLDCADICDAAANLGLRHTGSDPQTLHELLDLCARACDACATECEKLDHEQVGRPALEFRASFRRLQGRRLRDRQSVLGGE
jgi:hypothetical protein